MDYERLLTLYMPQLARRLNMRVDVYGYREGGWRPLTPVEADDLIPQPKLEEYAQIKNPQYIVREDGRCLLDAPGVQSRLILRDELYGGRESDLPVLFILSSPRPDAFDGDRARQVLEELFGFMEEASL